MGQELTSHTDSTLDTPEQLSEQDVLNLIVQRSNTTDTAKHLALTSRLPRELQINPNDQSRSKDEVLAYYHATKKLWQAATDHTTQMVVAKLCLQATGNIQFCNYLLDLQEEQDPMAEKDRDGLSEYVKSLVEWVEKFEKYVEFVYDNYDELVSHLSEDQTQKIDKQKVLPYLKEKMLTYESFIRALYLLKDEEEILKLLYARKKDDLHDNWMRVDSQLDEIRGALSEAEYAQYEQQASYCEQLISDQLMHLNHYARVDDYPQLVAARFLFERNSVDLFDRDPNLIFDVLQFFNQEALRAVDRVNDVFGTDRYVYTVLEGQVREAPVRYLPFIYKITAIFAPPEDEEKDTATGVYIPSLIYTAPTHPQAVHLMKKNQDITQLPHIFADSIRLYTSGMYTQRDFRKLYVEVVALSCKDLSITKELWDFVFTHVVVNEDSDLIKHPDGSFSVPNWLILSEDAADSQLAVEAQQVLDRVNSFCAEQHIVPPLRPYAVIPKETTFSKLSAVPNPESR